MFWRGHRSVLRAVVRGLLLSTLNCFFSGQVPIAIALLSHHSEEASIVGGPTEERENRVKPTIGPSSFGEIGRLILKPFRTTSQNSREIQADERMKAPTVLISSTGSIPRFCARRKVNHKHEGRYLLETCDPAPRQALRLSSENGLLFRHFGACPPSPHRGEKK